ncbi:hypothetical protein Esti_001369 [Eimeria stiedai]
MLMLIQSKFKGCAKTEPHSRCPCSAASPRSIRRTDQQHTSPPAPAFGDCVESAATCRSPKHLSAFVYLLFINLCLCLAASRAQSFTQLYTPRIGESAIVLSASLSGALVATLVDRALHTCWFQASYVKMTAPARKTSNSKGGKASSGGKTSSAGDKGEASADTRKARAAGMERKSSSGSGSKGNETGTRSGGRTES